MIGGEVLLLEEEDTRTGLQEGLLRPQVDDGETVKGDGEGDEDGVDIVTEGMIRQAEVFFSDRLSRRHDYKR